MVPLTSRSATFAIKICASRGQGLLPAIQLLMLCFVSLIERASREALPDCLQASLINSISRFVGCAFVLIVVTSAYCQIKEFFRVLSLINVQHFHKKKHMKLQMSIGSEKFEHVLPLAIQQFRKDWPFMAERLDSMRNKATPGGPACGVSAAAACASIFRFSGPDGNHGDNNLITVTALK